MADLENVVKRLEAVAAKLENLGVGGGAAVAGPPSEVVEEFDAVVEEFLGPFFAKSEELGGDVALQSANFKAAVDGCRQVIAIAAASKEADAATKAEILKLVSIPVEAAAELEKNKNRTDVPNHLRGLAEVMKAFSWVNISPAPTPYVGSCFESGDFYLMRALQKDKTLRPWNAALKGFFTEGLAAYVKKYHTTGLTWNPAGADAVAPTEFPAVNTGKKKKKGKKGKKGKKAAAAAEAAPAAAAAPAEAAKPAAKPAAGGDLFGELNQGGAVTSGLKKVKKSQKTKYRKGGSSKVPSDLGKKKKGGKKFGAAAVTKPPVFELQGGRKWAVEWQNEAQLKVEDCNPRQTVNVYKCEYSAVQVTGKANTIAIDSCNKTGVQFDVAVASVEIVNCSGCQIQVTGKVPTVTIDKCSGIEVYLSAECFDTEIIVAKSDSINITVPNQDGGDDDEDIEFALPEQFKSVWDAEQKKFVTSPVQHG